MGRVTPGTRQRQRARLWLGGLCETVASEEVIPLDSVPSVQGSSVAGGGVAPVWFFERLRRSGCYLVLICLLHIIIPLTIRTYVHRSTSFGQLFLLPSNERIRIKACPNILHNFAAAVPQSGMAHRIPPP